MKIWFVDDQAPNRQTWLYSFPKPLRLVHEFKLFATVDTLFEALEEIFPDILFIDYYIGPRTGSEVVMYFNGLNERPLLIAHSSMAQANRAMLQLGADLAFEKNPDAPITRSIQETITSHEDLLKLLQYKRIEA